MDNDDEGLQFIFSARAVSKERSKPCDVDQLMPPALLPDQSWACTNSMFHIPVMCLCVDVGETQAGLMLNQPSNSELRFK